MENINGGLNKPQVSLKDTQQVVSEDGNLVFQSGIIMRKVNKFLSGTKEDAVIPIEVLYDVKTGRVLLESVPSEIREEIKEFYQDSK